MEGGMKYGSICSGIEAASAAWHPLGWECAFVSEIDAPASDVLRYHYPTTPNLGDFTAIEKHDGTVINILVGGTPCQAFSVAGLRKGFADDRGNLTLEFLRLADRLRPTWVVWENVPGVLSVDDGRAFGSFLGGLAELGYGFAYRVLDAQYVRVESHARAVPQRRRRVFVVGHLGDWRRAAAVLFERESLCGYPAPSREAGKRVAPTLDVRAGKSGETSFHTSGGLAVASTGSVAHCLNAGGMGRQDYETETMIVQPVTYGLDEEQNATENFFGTLKARREGGGFEGVVAFGSQNSASQGDGVSLEYSPTLDKSKTPSVMQHGMAVRRLLPVECERLQGFPDGWTQHGRRADGTVYQQSDSQRYKQLGNSMAVNVMRWLGERIQMIDRPT
jgi:DNA (cytosine-5)-methyltransferase 1